MKFGRIPIEKLLIYSYQWQRNFGFDDGIAINLICIEQQFYMNIHAFCLLYTSRKESWNWTGLSSD